MDSSGAWGLNVERARALLCGDGCPHPADCELRSPLGQEIARAVLTGLVRLAFRGSRSGSPMEGRSDLQFAYLLDDWFDAALVHEIEAVHLLLGGLAVAVEQAAYDQHHAIVAIEFSWVLSAA